MSSSNNRFGRRMDRQNEEPRFEPVLSFDPKRPAPRPTQKGPDQNGPAPTAQRKPQAGLRVDREDARQFGVSFDDDIERHDDFDPRTRRDKAMEPRDTDAEQQLYRHLFDEQEGRRRGFGWLAALGSVAVVAIGAGYAWHNFMERPAPGSLFEPPGFAARGHNSGYMTPEQPPTAEAAIGGDAGSTSAPLAATAPAVTPPTPTDQQPTKDIAVAPVPKSAPAEPPPPPRKTISEAAANPGNLGPAATPTPPPAPPTAKEQPAVEPAPVVTAPPKRETGKTETPKREAPRKEASITPPRRAPAPQPQNIAPEDVAPPAMTEPAAAPAVISPPRRTRPQATGQPQALTREPPAAVYAAPPRPTRQSVPPDNLGPPPSAPDTVTVDGLTYVNGQEPRALGTLGGPPQAASNDAVMPPDLSAVAPPPRPAYTARPYTPTEHEGGAPLPNDVIILPSGQMAVPDGSR